MVRYVRYLHGKPGEVSVWGAPQGALHGNPCEVPGIHTQVLIRAPLQKVRTKVPDKGPRPRHTTDRFRAPHYSRPKIHDQQPSRPPKGHPKKRPFQDPKRQKKIDTKINTENRKNPLNNTGLPLQVTHINHTYTMKIRETSRYLLTKTPVSTWLTSDRGVSLWMWRAALRPTSPHRQNQPSTSLQRQDCLLPWPFLLFLLLSTAS